MQPLKECPSQKLHEIRNKLTGIRNDIQDLMCKCPSTADALDHYLGYCTTGISAMFNTYKDLLQKEIEFDDRDFGPSVSFKSRGIGLDVCPGCIICGGKSGMMDNIAAFVNSKSDGDKILPWFNKSFDCAYLDYREYEPNWIQVKVGACEKHTEALKLLDALTSTHGVIREHVVQQIREEVKDEN